MKKTFFALFVFIPGIALAQIPDFPMAFWGEVTVNGTAVPAGATVRVYNEDVLVGSVVTEESGVYGYTEPTKQKLLVSDADGELTFTVQAPSLNSGNEFGGTSAITYPEFAAGETVEKDLAFTTQATPPPSSGGGSRSSGGGGSKKTTVTPTEEVLGVATTTATTSPSPESERKILLQKQIIQLLTQLLNLLQLRLQSQ